MQTEHMDDLLLRLPACMIGLAVSLLGSPAGYLQVLKQILGRFLQPSGADFGSAPSRKWVKGKVALHRSTPACATLDLALCGV